MNAARDRVAQLAIVIVGVAFTIGITVLVLNLVFDFLDDDVSAAVAGFLGGEIAVLAYGVARWLGDTDDTA